MKVWQGFLLFIPVAVSYDEKGNVLTDNFTQGLLMSMVTHWFNSLSLKHDILFIAII